MVSSDGEHFEHYRNYGNSIIDVFCEREFCQENRGTTYIAHNAKGYDAHFIKEWCIRKGIQCDVLATGHKIMRLTLKGVNIRIIDSVNFMAVALRTFPTMFGLEKTKDEDAMVLCDSDSEEKKNAEPFIRKGVYPYAFNTRENWEYVGPMPELEEFLPGGARGVKYIEDEEKQRVMSKRVRDRDDRHGLLHHRFEIIRWWKDRARTGNQWNNLKELSEYCENDVKILALGCLQFQQNFMNLTKTNRWNAPEQKESRGNT